MTDSEITTCQSSCPVPVMEVHGTSDPEVPYWGSATSPSVDSIINYWMHKDKCRDTFDYATLDNCKTDSCDIEKYVYNECSDSSEIRKYEVVGGGHTWPGAPLLVSYLGHTDYDMNASVEIWEFFEKHRLQCGVVQGISPEYLFSKISYYPDPFINELHVYLEEIAQNVRRISLIDIYGRIVYTNHISGGNYFTLPASRLAAGIYFLKIETDNNAFIKPVIKAGN